VEVCFIGGGNLSTRRKPPTFNKSLTNHEGYRMLNQIALKLEFVTTEFTITFTSQADEK
jgi:hypothetical protein